MKPGPGGNYIQAFRDKDGNHFDGGKSYRLHVPANPPAAAFWSPTAYDSATRSMVQNPTNDAARASYDELKTNADGSFDMYFAPAASADQESNWIETVPRQGLLPDVPPLQPHCATVRRHLGTARRRADLTVIGDAPMRCAAAADAMASGAWTCASARPAILDGHPRRAQGRSRLRVATAADLGAVLDFSGGSGFAVFDGGLECGVVVFVLVGVGFGEVGDGLVEFGGAAEVGG
jgi:hypothetical protein